jgi:hypothetical protein
VVKQISLTLFIAAAAAVTFAAFGPLKSDTSAAVSPSTYVYLIGVEPLCTLDPTFCPDRTKAANGDEVTITGSGSLSVHPKSVSGGGNFIHKNESGAELAHGTWDAVRLESFVPTGQNGDFPPGFTGGVAIMKIDLHPSTGGVISGTFWIDCYLEAGPSGHGEGVRLAVPGIANFNKHTHGNTVFIQTSP